MKKKIMALALAALMTVSVTGVAFADNGNHKNKGNNGNPWKKGKTEIKIDKHSSVDIQKEIKKVEKKIEQTNKQIQNWTALKAEVEKKIAANGVQVATGDVIRVELFNRQLTDLEAWHTAAIAVAGRTVEQINEINKLYTAEKTILTAKLTKAQNVNANKGEGLQNALAQANKKIDQYTKELAELNKKLAELKAKAAVTPIPTVTPVPTVTP